MHVYWPFGMICDHVLYALQSMHIQHANIIPHKCVVLPCRGGTKLRQLGKQAYVVSQDTRLRVRRLLEDVSGYL